MRRRRRKRVREIEVEKEEEEAWPPGGHAGNEEEAKA